MIIDEIFNYVMESPENTNPSVLKDMLNRLNVSNTNVGGGSMQVHINFPDDYVAGEYAIMTMDKTWQEIHDALVDGIVVQAYFMRAPFGMTEYSIANLVPCPIVKAQVESEGGAPYTVTLIERQVASSIYFYSWSFYCSSANDYPTADIGGGD